MYRQQIEETSTERKLVNIALHLQTSGAYACLKQT
jgi:hypothetical protein